MALAPLFPVAIDEITAWLQGQEGVIRCNEKESLSRPRVWRLARPLAGVFPHLVLQFDFPLSPARIEFEPGLCFRFPHIETDGHFCHGDIAQPADVNDPSASVKRVLEKLAIFNEQCEIPGWTEREFHKESEDYWNRREPLKSVPKDYRTKKLLLQIDPQAGGAQEGSALILPDGRGLATLAREPEAVAKAIGWSVGTITRGGVLVARLPDSTWWTPSSWPQSFSELEKLVSELTGTSARLSAWMSHPWPNKAGIFVVLLHGPSAYGWRVFPAQPPLRPQPVISPLEVKRIDRQWSLSRDHKVPELNKLSEKRVVVFGCGSLGGPVIELLARAGVGHIHVVDPDIFEPENISRHVLGLSAVDYSKASTLCARLVKSIPGSNLTPSKKSALEWIDENSGRPAPDLVLDCTGERSVRIGTSMLRDRALGGAPVLMSWMEPFCAAAHVVVVTGDDKWPLSDPVEAAVNIATWPDTEVVLSGCGQGFHRYGMADTYRVAGLVAERALSLLNDSTSGSGIWSFTRDRAYFENAAPGVQFNREPPQSLDVEAITTKRNLKDALNGF